METPSISRVKALVASVTEGQRFPLDEDPLSTPVKVSRLLKWVQSRVPKHNEDRIGFDG